MNFFNKPKEDCGVFGVFGHKDAAKLTYFGLYALQHRGQESAGIVSSTEREINEHKGMGLVPEIFDENTLEKLRGHIAVGHVRYSTTGSSVAKNIQPFVVNYQGKTYAIAHNGNLVNAGNIRRTLEKKGSIFQTTMDTEVILHLLAHSLVKGLSEAIVTVVSQIKGAYSCVLMTDDKIIAFRDPHGFRPLSLGLLDNAYVVASETCAFDLIEAQYIRDIEPGEILIIDKNGLKSIRPFPRHKHSFCIFELIYFARPDSTVFGLDVYSVRKALGKSLAREYSIDADFAMPFPDSGNYAAIGFCQESGIPMEMGVIRNHYVGRTFINPVYSMRGFNVKVKLNPVKHILNQRKVIIVEDSIIRGTTSKMRVKALREAGAWNIHMVVSCPPTKYPCFYGIDFPTEDELIASGRSVDEIKNYIGLDSLSYLSLDGMVEATGLPGNDFCLACFNGKYPVNPEQGISKSYLETQAP
jgi:amidophosphoribosyltransferase